jgi:hypothetical protein
MENEIVILTTETDGDPYDGNIGDKNKIKITLAFCYNML